MKHNQNHDLKKGSADRGSTGQKRGMPDGRIGRGDMSMGSSSGSSTRNASGRSDYGGSESSRERKPARNGSHSSDS